VLSQDRRVPLGLADGIGDTTHQRDVDKAVGRVGRCLDQDHRHPALAHGLLGSLVDRRLIDAVGKADRADRESRQRIRQQGFRPAIKRLRVQDDVAGANEGQNCGRDGRHAGREQRTAFGALIDGEPVLDDLAVGMVEARIDQSRAHALRRLATARDEIEEVLPVLGRLEHEGRGQKHRRLDGAFRQLRIVAIGQHQRFRMQHMVADMGFRRERFRHGLSRCS
jgi:hypothetical protein